MRSCIAHIVAFSLAPSSFYMCQRNLGLPEPPCSPWAEGASLADWAGRRSFVSGSGRADGAFSVSQDRQTEPPQRVRACRRSLLSWSGRTDGASSAGQGGQTEHTQLVRADRRSLFSAPVASKCRLSLVPVSQGAVDLMASQPCTRRPPGRRFLPPPSGPDVINSENSSSRRLLLSLIRR